MDIIEVPDVEPPTKPLCWKQDPLTMHRCTIMAGHTGDHLWARGWQPIRTAPKDGTVIIGMLMADHHVWRVTEMWFNGLAWYTSTGYSLPAMTHWMPMPVTTEL